MTPYLSIAKQTLQRFILGKQGLYPGRRWQGKTGIEKAINEGAVVQIDPLNIVARSHDIALHSRVRDYAPQQLNQLLYEERAGFDYSGTVMLHPMAALPYWRAVMAHNATRRAYLGEQNEKAVVEVLAALSERGPLANRDFYRPTRAEKVLARRQDHRSGLILPVAEMRGDDPQPGCAGLPALPERTKI